MKLAPELHRGLEIEESNAEPSAFIHIYYQKGDSITSFRGYHPISKLLSMTKFMVRCIEDVVKAEQSK